MTSSRVSEVIQHISKIVLRSDGAGMSDSQLMSRYIDGRDEDAFAALVKRHAPMVWGVCRRLLSSHQDAEDAFQATFLVLVRKAATVASREMVANWLYGVAYMTAHRAKVAAAKRHRREKQVMQMPEPTADKLDVWEDLRPLLDRELSRLPDKYRAVILLCDLEGKTRQQVAQQLGLPEGTVARRLARARSMLAKRLTRHGFGLSGGALAALLSENAASAGVPTSVIFSTIKAANLFAVGQAMTVGAISMNVAALTEGVLKTMLLTKLTNAAAALLVMFVMVVGAGTVISRTIAAQPPKNENVKEADKAPPQPAVPKVERKPAAAPLPEGAIARIGSPRLRHAGEVGAVAFSTDGRWLASASADDHDRTVRVWNLADGAEKLRVPIEVNSNGTPASQRTVAVGFSKDGQHLRVIDFNSYRVIDRDTGRQILQHRFYEKAPRQGWDPPNVVGAAFSPDLRTYAVVRQNGELILADAATGKVQHTIAKGAAIQENRAYAWVSLAFSSDGRRVCIPLDSEAVKIFDTATGDVISTLRLKQTAFWASAFLKGGEEFAYLANDAGKDVVEVINVADGKRVRQIPVEATAKCLDVSPDGKYLAVGNLQRQCIQMLDPLTGKEIRRIPRSFSEARVVFSPDSSLLAGVSYWSGSVSVWETRSGKRLPSSADGVEYLRGFDRDGRVVVCVDSRYQITDWRTGHIFGDLPIQHAWPNNVTYSLDHRLKAYHTMVKPEDWKPEKGFPITVRDTATAKEVSRLIGNTDFCQRMVFTDDSKRLITISQDAAIRLWEVATGKELWSEKQPVRFGYTGTGIPHLSGDGRRLTVLCQRSNQEMELRVWDLVAKNRVAEIPTPYLFFGGIDFSHDGKFIAGGGSDRKTAPDGKGMVFVWDVDAGKVCRKLTGHSPGNISCRFAPDGRTLSTVDETGLIRIWELSTGQERFRITGHRGSAEDYFSPGSALLAGWSNEAPVLIWDVYGFSHPPESFDAEKAWQTLGDKNAARAFTAMRRLCSAPERTAKLLREKLKPVEKVEAETIRKWIGELDDDSFATREAAQKSLEKLGDRAEKPLRAALQQSPSVEMRARVNRLLEALDTPTPDQLRRQRAVEVLQRIGSAEAKAIAAQRRR